MSTHAAIEHGHAADEHIHPPSFYVKIWGILTVLFAISVAGPMLGIKLVTILTAFGIAIVKAYLVAKNFMHVNIEGRWVAYLLIGMVAFMVVLFWGVAPDVMEHQGQRWQKLYTEPAHTAPAHAE